MVGSHETLTNARRIGRLIDRPSITDGVQYIVADLVCATTWLMITHSKVLV